MDGSAIKDTRETYASSISNDDPNRSAEILSTSVYTPITELRELHPEAEPVASDINKTMSEVACDITAIDNEFIDAANHINDLVINIKSRLKTVYNTLSSEQERLQDINLLCNEYSDFANVLNLDESYFEGSFASDNNTFTLPMNTNTDVSYDIISITGNGYEGNAHVYNNNAFTADTYDTSKRANINDKNNLTQYEYSRITIDSTDSNLPAFVNLDTVEALCTITIHGAKTINQLMIDTDISNLEVIGIYTSIDGISFNQVDFENIKVNDSSKKYELSSYINGAGIINFEDANYIKIVLQSNGYTNDTIAYYKNE